MNGANVLLRAWYALTAASSLYMAYDLFARTPSNEGHEVGLVIGRSLHRARGASGLFVFVQRTIAWNS